MKYIDNISVNLKKEFINFYEWNEIDKITKINKVQIYKVNNDTYYDLLKYNINVTETGIINKIVIFCNDFDSICIKFDNNGNSVLRSKLLLEEESNIIDIMLRDKCFKLNYKILEEVKYSYNTREENYILDKIGNFINSNKDNIDIINYLSYEWFNKKINNYNRLLELVNTSSKEEINKLYETIKIINV